MSKSLTVDDVWAMCQCFSLSRVVLRLQWVKTGRLSDCCTRMRPELREIRGLVASGSMRVTVFDKGGEFVRLPSDGRSNVSSHGQDRTFLQDHTLYSLCTLPCHLRTTGTTGSWALESILHLLHD